jgi:hypothetical protein
MQTRTSTPEETGTAHQHQDVGNVFQASTSSSETDSPGSADSDVDSCEYSDHESLNFSEENESEESYVVGHYTMLDAEDSYEGELSCAESCTSEQQFASEIEDFIAEFEPQYCQQVSRDLSTSLGPERSRLSGNIAIRKSIQITMYQVKRRLFYPTGGSSFSSCC